MNLWEKLVSPIIAFQAWRKGPQEPPLCKAIMQHDTDTVAALLAEGADPNTTSTNGMTMLMWAAYMDNPECARLLMDHGTDVNATQRDGTTALHFTQQSKYGNPRVIVELLKRGADPNVVTDDGYTPLYSAVSGPHRREALRALLEGGVDIHRKYNGLNALEMARMHSKGEENEITAMLRQAGAKD